MAEQKYYNIYLSGTCINNICSDLFLVYPAIIGVKDVEKSKLVLEKELRKRTNSYKI